MSTTELKHDEYRDLLNRIDALESALRSLKRGRMPYCTLGACDFEVSKISLGCAPLGGVYGSITADDAQRIVDDCLGAGVNFFDTSPYYGETESERVLGECLKKTPFPRDKYFVATKVGRYVDEGSNFSEKRVRDSIEESLNRLQVDSIDLIQCHDVEFSSSLFQVIHEALPALEEAKAAGKVKHIGITGLPLNVVDFVLEQSSADISTVLSYCCYTLNNTNLLQYLPRWKHRNLGIIQGGATSMGLLSPQGPQDWHPAPDAIKKACADAVKLCEETNEDISKLAFQYTASLDDLHTILIGVTSPEQLKKNLGWINSPLNTSLIDQIEACLAPIKNKIWVEKGSEENIALSYGGFWASGHRGSEEQNVISGASSNLGKSTWP